MSSAVAFLGPEGTFSHIVALRRYPKRPGLPCATITEVFHAVRCGQAACGIVPIENSSGGTITETVDLLIEQEEHLAIAEELALDVRLALLGKRDPRSGPCGTFTPMSCHSGITAIGSVKTSPPSG